MMNEGKKIINMHINEFNNAKRKKEFNIGKLFGIDENRIEQLKDLVENAMSSKGRASDSIAEVISEARTREELIFISVEVGVMLQINNMLFNLTFNPETINIILDPIADKSEKDELKILFAMANRLATRIRKINLKHLSKSDVLKCINISDVIGKIIVKEIDSMSMDDEKKPFALLLVAGSIAYATFSLFKYMAEEKML